MNPLQFRRHHQPPPITRGSYGKRCVFLLLGRPRYSRRIVVSSSLRTETPQGGRAERGFAQTQNDRIRRGIRGPGSALPTGGAWRVPLDP